MIKRYEVRVTDSPGIRERFYTYSVALKSKRQKNALYMILGSKERFEIYDRKLKKVIG